MTRGRFVAFEGGDATGKSTQARLLAERMGAVLTREPGGTRVGERLRDLVLDPAGRISDRTEALLMAAARAQHVADVVEPALAAGRDVVTDRYVASSVAYQGHGRGLPPDEVLRLSLWATDNLLPDLAVLLELPDEVAASRLGPTRDRMELAGDAFHRAVVAGFRLQAATDPGRWIVIDGDRPIDVVAADIADAVERRLK